MKKSLRIFLILICFFVCTSCQKNNQVKYIFLFIGDGMSYNQIELTEIYQNALLKNDFNNQSKLSFTDFPTVGIKKSYNKDNYTPDSASSASVLSSGHLVRSGALNKDADTMEEYQPITYLLQKQRDMKIGIVTNVALNHATPAAFYANNVSRDNYHQIAKDLIKSDFDFFAGARFLTDSNFTNEQMYKLAKEAKYQVITDNMETGHVKNKLIIVNKEGFPYGIDKEGEPKLADYVKMGINNLDQKNGFFMVVESGKIDYAGHNNDAKGVISEVNELNDSVLIALDFYEKNPESTLIIVTGDHETGGLVLGGNYGNDYNYLLNQKYSKDFLTTYINNVIANRYSFEELLVFLSDNYGLSVDDYNKIIIDNATLKEFKSLYDDMMGTKNSDKIVDKVIYVINQSSDIVWTTNNHTASSVPVYVKGDKGLFSGVYDSVGFNQRLKQILKIK